MAVAAVSAVDGRYEAQTRELSRYFSESALIKYRINVEVEWLVLMSERPEFPEVRAFTAEERALLRGLVQNFSDADAERVKEIERTTNHDVKAVEYFIKERLAGTSLAEVGEFVHFGCTSEDINNLSYAQMLRDGVRDVWQPLAVKLVDGVAALAETHRDRAMLSRTHGQPATPTTLGKELAVFVYRWRRQLAQVDRIEYLGKFSGATGTFSAHLAAYPEAPWEEISQALVARLGLTWNPLTTQIESHDYMAELFHALIRFNNITLDFDRDVWTYISLGYFRQKLVKGEVGSSAMPHKVNPINFENSEANAGVSNALLQHLANTLPISRMQRDLTDSSTQRTIGTALSHAVISLASAVRGLGRLAVDPAALDADLDANWPVLAEAIQTVMRRAGFANPYETLKEFSRGQELNEGQIREFIRQLDLSTADRDRLLALTPATYTGLAATLIRHMELPKG